MVPPLTPPPSQKSFEVLEGLLCEDDEVVGVWYLMGWLHYITADRDSALFYLEQTEKVWDCPFVSLVLQELYLIALSPPSSLMSPLLPSLASPLLPSLTYCLLSSLPFCVAVHQNGV